jgi:hypothetical protein
MLRPTVSRPVSCCQIIHQGSLNFDLLSLECSVGIATVYMVAGSLRGANNFFFFFFFLLFTVHTCSGAHAASDSVGTEKVVGKTAGP